MFHRSTRAFSGVRAGLAGLLLAGTLVVSLGVDVAPSAAFSGSPFCSAIFSFETHEGEAAAAPTSLSGYAAWSKTLLPYYENIAAKAPSGNDKLVFNAVVKVLKYLASNKNPTNIQKYLKLNSAKLSAAGKSVGKSVASCA